MNIAERREICLRAVIARAPTDRASAETAIEKIYSAFDRPRPEFVWFDNPNDFAARLEQAPSSDRTQRDFCQTFEHGTVHARVHDFINTLVGSVRAKWKSSLYARMILPLTVAVGGHNHDVADLFLEALRFVPFWVALDGTCVCCDRPTQISVDPAFRLQSRDGAEALRYASGWSLFADRGALVPTAWTAKQSKSSLTELMRVMTDSDHRKLGFIIDRYGRDKFCKDFGRVVDDDSRYGTLYDTGMMHWNNIGNIVFLKVNNSTPDQHGSSTVHYIRVPPTIRRALDGVAWTFGITAREYQAGLVSEA